VVRGHTLTTSRKNDGLSRGGNESNQGCIQGTFPGRTKGIDLCQSRVKDQVTPGMKTTLCCRDTGEMRCPRRILVDDAEPMESDDGEAQQQFMEADGEKAEAEDVGGRRDSSTVFDGNTRRLPVRLAWAFLGHRDTDLEGDFPGAPESIPNLSLGWTPGPCYAEGATPLCCSHS
jgi:hypothetical protein